MEILAESVDSRAPESSILSVPWSAADVVQLGGNRSGFGEKRGRNIAHQIPIWMPSHQGFSVRWGLSKCI